MRFHVPDDKVLTFETTIPLRWGDMDAMGHVNNTLYFRYLEIVRLDWFDALAVAPGRHAHGPLIVNAFCSFIRQVEYPGTLLARHYCGAIGTSSLDTYVTLARTDSPDRIDAEGGATVVWTDYRAQRSTPIPDEWRAVLRRPWRARV